MAVEQYDKVVRFKQSIVMTDYNELPPKYPEFLLNGQATISTIM